MLCRASGILKKMTGEKPDAAPKVKEDKKFDASRRVGNRDTWLAIKVREKTPHGCPMQSIRVRRLSCVEAIYACDTACHVRPRWNRTTG